MTPEGKVKAMVKKALKEIGAYCFMPVQNGYGAPGLDFYCCHKGWFFAVETKAPGKGPTTKQCRTMDEIELSSGAVYVVDDISSLEIMLDDLNAPWWGRR